MSGYAYLGIFLTLVGIVVGALLIGRKLEKGRAARESLKRRANIDEGAIKIDEQTEKILRDLDGPDGVNDFWMRDKPE